MNQTIQPTYFLSHGGGPWPFMKAELDGMFDQLETSLQQIPAQLPEKPLAVLVISGHWEESQWTLSSSATPPMVFDYYGFPEYTYRISYPAPGAPALAAKIQKLLVESGFSSMLDGERGFDHGTFSMLHPMYPHADMPIVQLSLQRSLDPLLHVSIGRALAPLRSQGVLIIGSGASYHNLRRFDAGASEPARLFDQWLRETLVELSPEQRLARTLQWQAAPAARFAHPREEHLLPLMVALGAAEDEPGQCIYHQSDMYGHIALSSYRFG